MIGLFMLWMVVLTSPGQEREFLMELESESACVEAQDDLQKYADGIYRGWIRFYCTEASGSWTTDERNVTPERPDASYLSIGTGDFTYSTDPTTISSVPIEGGPSEPLCSPGATQCFTMWGPSRGPDYWQEHRRNMKEIEDAWNALTGDNGNGTATLDGSTMTPDREFRCVDDGTGYSCTFDPKHCRWDVQTSEWWPCTTTDTYVIFH